MTLVGILKRNSGIFCLIGLFLLLSTSCNTNKSYQNNTFTFNSTFLDSLFNDAIKNKQIPAAAVYIAVDGKAVYHKGFGKKDIASNVPLKKTDIFRIASMTKAVTATASMQLVEKGKLSLDDPVYKYLPEFKNPTVLIDVLPDSSFTSRLAKSEITIRQLLTHTSGIGYGFQSEIYNALIIKNGISEGFEERPILLRENIKKLAQIPLMHDPGEKYTYSLSMDVMGAVIEVASGEKLDEYFYNHIIKPMGMIDTYFYLPDEKANRLVSVYEHNGDKTGFIPATYPFTEYPVQGAKMFLSGGADLNSTVLDIGIFGQMLLNKGIYNGTRILESSSVETITSGQTEHGWWDYDIGFGVSVVTKEGAAKKPMSVGSYDWGGFFDTYGWVDPQKNFVAVLLLQMYPTNEFEIHQKFQQITYEIINEHD